MKPSIQKRLVFILLAITIAITSCAGKHNQAMAQSDLNREAIQVLNLVSWMICTAETRVLRSIFTRHYQIPGIISSFHRIAFHLHWP